ncbi:MAG: TerB family tellurite resistance protein [Defluviicoccus sp.]|nr:MAG: TerB family tellurite resistance protein [Defluviicoccus sp.]
MVAEDVSPAGSDRNSMWGKIFGSFAGFAMGGPIGALFGVAAGHAYDQMRDDGEPGSCRPPWGEGWGGFGPFAALGASSEASRQMIFSVAVIVLSAKMAKADGVVNRAEIDAFKEVFRVSTQDAHKVARIFDQAKREPGGFEPYAQQVERLFRHEPAVLEDLLASLFYIARADGEIDRLELAFLKRVAAIFNLGNLAFDRVRSMFIKGEGDPYDVLGLSENVSDEEVKRTYRKLIREHHPDVLMARGVPKSFIEMATQKMASINSAYDQIERERGLK